MNEKSENGLAKGQQLIQLVVDNELDFIEAVNRVSEAHFSTAQWRQLALGLMEDRLMRSAAVQVQQEAEPVFVQHSDAVSRVEERNTVATWYKPVLALAALVLIALTSFWVGQGVSGSGSILSPAAGVSVASEGDQKSINGVEPKKLDEVSPEHLVTKPFQQPGAHLVKYPVDIEQLRERGQFNRSDIEDGFVTQEQRRQLMQSGYLVDELVGTTVLTVSSKLKQPVATRLICVRYVGDLSVQ